MPGSTTGNWWQYSRWVFIVGRSLRMNGPSGSERTAVKTFLTSELSARPWMQGFLEQRSSTGRSLDIANEQDYNLALMVQFVGRDLKKIPMTDAEKTLCDTLFAATGTRRLGNQGGPAGSIS